MLAEVQHQKEATQVLRALVDGSLDSPLLLVGPEGVGRKLSVLKAVQEAFCATKTLGCQCASCYALEGGTHPDFRVLTAEKQIGVDEVRALIQEAKVFPDAADFKCFVIDGADRFTDAAANAFLKTLEEPPARSKFFLIAEQGALVLPTIRSRCGLVRYQSLPNDFIVSVVTQHESDPVRALVYSQMGEGSVGRAVRYWGAGKIALRDQVLQVLHQTATKDLPGIFSSVDGLEQELELVLQLLNQLLRDVVIAQAGITSKLIHSDLEEVLVALGSKTDTRKWARLADQLQALQEQFRAAPALYLPFHLKTRLASFSV